MIYVTEGLMTKFEEIKAGDYILATLFSHDPIFAEICLVGEIYETDCRYLGVERIVEKSLYRKIYLVSKNNYIKRLSSEEIFTALMEC